MLGFSTFNLSGDPTLVTLYSEVTDASQNQPGIVLPVNYRSFDAVYLPDAGVGQDPATFTLSFLPATCEVTFNSIGELDNSTNLQCSIGLRFGPASGGFYNDASDEEFTVIFTTNILGDCSDAPKEVELFFSREFLNLEEFTTTQFSHFVSRDKQLSIDAKGKAIEAVSIYNLAGQKITTAQFNSDKANLDLSAHQTGIYLAKVKSAYGVSSFKFILR